MKVRIIGDVHEGKRFAYTTPKSSLLFQEMHREAKRIAVGDAQVCFQVGDLFDSFSGLDGVLIRGYEFGRRMKLLAGNHDKSNNTERSSSLQLLRDHLALDVAWEEIKVDDYGNTTFYRVPHQLTQDKFDAILLEAERLRQSSTTGFNVLLLHCNYGTHAGVETENYLRPEVAERLLQSFSLIVSGHEHNFSYHFEERLIMVGSIMPFSFGEMQDKGVLEYDTITGLWDVACTWSSKDFSFNKPNKFTEVVGSVSVEEAAALNRQIADWYKTGEVIAVKNSTQLIRHDKEAISEAHKAEDWLVEITRQCDETQAALLQELYEEC